MSKPFYIKSNIVNFESNVMYDDLIGMTDEEVDSWIDLLRGEVITQWDNEESPTPPTIGKLEEGIVKAFSSLRSYDTSGFFSEDPDDEHSYGLVANFSKNSGTVNQFFPTMLKTRITTGVNVEGAKSIYDYFSKDELRDAFKHTMIRALIKDSMCSYTKSLHHTKNDEIDWADSDGTTFFEKYGNDPDIGVFIRPYMDKNLDKITNKYKKQGYVVYHPAAIVELYNRGLITDQMLRYCGGIEGVTEYELSDRKEIKQKKKETDEEFVERQRLDEIDRRQYHMYLVRYYPRKFKIFPKALQTFRLSLGQPAVNYPALTARWLYEHFTSHINTNEKVNIYDPSAGWGGRILGAMAAERAVHYIGTDPNTNNHNVTAEIDGEEKTQSRYEWVADFYNNKCLPLAEPPEFGNMYKRELKKLPEDYVEGVRHSYRRENTHHIFDVGSEHIGNHPDFQQYKGKLDFVFTSPPYFHREQYSQDDTQSFKAYAPYEVWRDKFLQPTLENAAESLRSDRYLAFNIANIKVNKTKKYPTGYLPLEDDSISILESCGMVYKGKLKQLMTQMQGLDVGELENSCMYQGKPHKYEPILVFLKH
jgi:hypothetical protein